MGKTYYQWLQLKNGASIQQIKGNYHRLAKIYHPDVYKGKNKNIFQKIKEAYELLRVPQKKYQYDVRIGVNTKPFNVPPQKVDTEHQSKPNQFYRFTQSSSDNNFKKEHQEFHSSPILTKVQQIRMYQMPAFRQATQEQRLRQDFVMRKNNQIQFFIKYGHQRKYQQMIKEQVQMVKQCKKQKEQDKHYSKVVDNFQKNSLPRYYLYCLLLVNIILIPTVIYRVDKKMKQKEIEGFIMENLKQKIQQENKQKLLKRFVY